MKRTAVEILAPLFDTWGEQRWTRLPEKEIRATISTAILAIESAPAYQTEFRDRARAWVKLDEAVKMRDEHAFRYIGLVAEAYGILKGYYLPDKVIAKYKCGTCGRGGQRGRMVKLWREINDGDRGWCAACGSEYTGTKEPIGSDGKHDSDEFGPSDQMYTREVGKSLLPWVPDKDGSTWGYTSVPPEGYVWWKELPL